MPSLRSCSVGPPPSAIHGRGRLTRHPCRVAHCAEPPLSLPRGRVDQDQDQERQASERSACGVVKSLSAPQPPACGVVKSLSAPQPPACGVVKSLSAPQPPVGAGLPAMAAFQLTRFLADAPNHCGRACSRKLSVGCRDIECENASRAGSFLEESVNSPPEPHPDSRSIHTPPIPPDAPPTTPAATRANTPPRS